MATTKTLRYLQDLWDEGVALGMEQSGNRLELLRYRSNLLGADLRITNFGGGNTSSKIEQLDPFTRQQIRVLAVKGSGGDLGSMTAAGFSLLYLDKLEELKALYRGEEHEDEMVAYYPLAAFGANQVAASIDTPLHAFLPLPEIDHLHPDWAIAVAASANDRQKLEEFNREFGRNIVWIPWRRPGFALALEIEDAVKQHPNADGIILAGHGLFTWGMTSRSCYMNSIQTIDEMGQFVLAHQEKRPVVFGGLDHAPMKNRSEVATSILPLLRGALSSNRRVVAHYTDDEEALTFAGSKWARELSRLGTSCPDHFLRTRVCPLFLGWDHTAEDVHALKAKMCEQVSEYRAAYTAYYREWATSASPEIRDANPSVVIIPGVGLFGFGRDKKEARITSEFFMNAIRVMAGATALEEGPQADFLPQASTKEQSMLFEQFHNYVALPRSEAFKIEYWPLEEAKLRRMPAEKEFSRKIMLVMGGASGIGRELVQLLASRGAHVVVADVDEAGAQEVAEEVASRSSRDMVRHVRADLSSSRALSDTVNFAVLQYGGIDGIAVTAAIYLVTGAGDDTTHRGWADTFAVNVTGNFLLARAAEPVFQQQRLTSALVLTSSANAVVPKSGTEAYDASKAAVNHLVRELAIRLSPYVRVNAIAPATVLGGSTMFPRDRVIQSLQKYGISFSDEQDTEELRSRLSDFYASRTLMKRRIEPEDCARAILWLLSDKSAKTTGHIVPVDGGLPEAFLR